MSPLRWTCKSTRQLTKELTQKGFPVSSSKVSNMLRDQGFNLQANKKTVEGKQHPDHIVQLMAALKTDIKGGD